MENGKKYKKTISVTAEHRFKLIFQWVKSGQCNKGYIQTRKALSEEN